MVRLLAVDGTSLAHRAWHSTRATPDRDADRDTDRPSAADGPGGDLLAVLGALASMLASTWRHGPYDVALIALDHPVNRRRELFPEYKAQREPSEPGLRGVLDALPDELARAGVPVRVQAGVEADDLLASAVDGARARSWRTDLLSSDRDMIALVATDVRLLRPRRRFAELTVDDEAAVEAEYGVPPAQYRDLAALRGDPSDGLDGAPGIGPATAARLLRDYGSVPAIYRALADLPPRVAAGLRSGRDAVERNLLLMAPLPHLDVDLDAARAQGQPLVGLARLLDERGATAAAGRLRRAIAGGAAGPGTVTAASTAPPLPPPPEGPD